MISVKAGQPASIGGRMCLNIAARCPKRNNQAAEPSNFQMTYKEENMDAAWIVSANAGKARIYAQENPRDSLKEIDDMANSVIRQQVSDMVDDRRGPHAATGSMHSVGGTVPNKTYESNETPQEHEANRFARELAAYLLQAHRENRFRELTLVAAPSFLGVLRQVMDPHLSAVIKNEINKDYTQYTGAQLLDKIQTHQEKQ